MRRARDVLYTRFTRGDLLWLAIHTTKQSRRATVVEEIRFSDASRVYQH